MWSDKIRELIEKKREAYEVPYVINQRILRRLTEINYVVTLKMK